MPKPEAGAHEAVQFRGKLIIMADNTEASEKLRRIVEALPKKNCGKCGFENCGKFAAAIAAGQASPFGCRQDASAGYTISNILGVPLPEKAAEQTSKSGFLSRHGSYIEHSKLPGRPGHTGHRGHHGHHKG